MKNNITTAVKNVFDNMPDTFYAVTFIDRVRLVSSTMAFDSSILRILRKVRQDNPKEYNWKCIDKEKAIYQKIK